MGGEAQTQFEIGSMAMLRHKDYLPRGVIPAALLPFHEDLSIDAASFRSHLRDLAAVEGISAITINAHASEVASCSFDEQQYVLELTQDAIGERLPIVNGIYSEGPFEAVRLAKMAQAGGASSLLVFPSGVYTFGQRPEMAVDYFKRIADVTDLPLILFQYPLAGGQGYPLATLTQHHGRRAHGARDQGLVRQSAAARAPDPRAAVAHAPSDGAETHSAWLLSSLVLGCHGLLSGSGSVIAELQAQLFRAVQADDLAGARKLNDRIWPTAEVFYADPWVDMHNRMKEALVLLGRLPRAVVRPPLMKLSAAEIERIRQALLAAGLLADAGVAKRRASLV